MRWLGQCGRGADGSKTADTLPFSPLKSQMQNLFGRLDSSAGVGVRPLGQQNRIGFFGADP